MIKDLKYLNKEQKGAILKAIISQKIKKEDLNNKNILKLFKYELPITFTQDDWRENTTFLINNEKTNKETFFSLKKVAEGIFKDEDLIFLILPKENI
jgi:hypothetical protein